MQPVVKGRWLTHNAEDTRTLGMCLGRQARPGDFIACYGPLGAGKTTFIQGFAQGLEVTPDAYVRSPTFTLMHEYDGRCPLYHFDFYRLLRAEDVLDIGFDDYCEAGGVVIAEWADKFTEILPAKRLELTIEILTTARRAIHVAASDSAYARYLHCTVEGWEV